MCSHQGAGPHPSHRLLFMKLALEPFRKMLGYEKANGLPFSILEKRKLRINTDCAFKSVLMIPRLSLMVFIKLANIFIEIITPFLPHLKVPKSLFYNPMGASFMLSIRGTEKKHQKEYFSPSFMMPFNRLGSGSPNFCKENKIAPGWRVMLSIFQWKLFFVSTFNAALFSINIIPPKFRYKWNSEIFELGF